MPYTPVYVCRHLFFRTDVRPTEQYPNNIRRKRKRAQQLNSRPRNLVVLVFEGAPFLNGIQLYEKKSKCIEQSKFQRETSTTTTTTITFRESAKGPLNSPSFTQITYNHAHSPIFIHMHIHAISKYNSINRALIRSFVRSFNFICSPALALFQSLALLAHSFSTRTKNHSALQAFCLHFYMCIYTQPFHHSENKATSHWLCVL